MSTPNYNFHLPQDNAIADQRVYNENFEMINTELKRVEDKTNITVPGSVR